MIYTETYFHTKMSAKKSLEQVYQEMQQQRIMESQRREAQEKDLFDQREKARLEWLRKMKMYELSSSVSPSSSSSAGAGSGGGRLLIQVIQGQILTESGNPLFTESGISLTIE